MTIKRVLKIILCAFVFAQVSFSAEAALFSAPDKAFTIDLPSDWKILEKKGAVIYAKKGKSTFEITKVNKCSGLSCLEKAIDKDISATKLKKHKIIVNTYTGESVKKTEFSTSDPLLSFNFTGKGGEEYTHGYFLADGKAYKVEIKGLSYVESDLILSFISPAPRSIELAGADTAAELTDLEMGDISIDEQPVVEEDMPIIINDNEPLDAAPKDLKESAKIQVGEAKVKINLKSAGPSGSLLIVVMLYALLLFCAFMFRLLFPAKKIKNQSNPRSVYPVRGNRFYGSPDLFFRFYDNQGANYIATTPRWDGIFTGIGCLAALFFFLLKALLVFIITGGYVNFHPVVINTLLSLCSLFSVFGLLIFGAGILTSLLFASKFYFYNDKGGLVFRCVQQGIALLKEEYAVANKKNAVLFRLSRDRFRLTRRWTVCSGDEIIAIIKERSLPKVLLRKCIGHLFGFLRTEYTVDGRVESKGTIKYEKDIFTNLSCEIDKPEAIDSRFLIIACAVISMRDRDKWYPWVN